MRIAVVGGGPAGLFFSRLIKRHRRDIEVRVFEQNPPDATFGFGVGLGETARDRVRARDAELMARIEAAMIYSDRQNIHLNGVDTLIEYAQAGGAMERVELLQILNEACLDVGVQIDSQVRVGAPEDLDGYDLIVAADGINSALRQARCREFGTQISHLTNHFAWYGVARAMTPRALVFRSRPEGVFIAHYYAYKADMSTFVAECTQEAWVRSDMADMTDTERRRFMEDIFAPELDGAALVENRSIWRQFPVIHNPHWSVGSLVLIGDALLGAHYSIGSGTRLAMDDAAALFDAVIDGVDGVDGADGADGADMASALALFRARREPVRARFRDAAARSYGWYENIAHAMAKAPTDFAYDFLTRTGRIDDAKLATYSPKFFQDYQAHRRVATVAR